MPSPATDSTRFGKKFRLPSLLATHLDNCSPTPRSRLPSTRAKSPLLSPGRFIGAQLWGRSISLFSEDQLIVVLSNGVEGDSHLSLLLSPVAISSSFVTHP